jgi:5'(3')-deoxyribonucleotidase
VLLFPWERSARELLERHRDCEIPASESWDWIQTRCSPADWRWLWDEGVRLGLFNHLAPYPGAEKGVERLTWFGDFAFVTIRPDDAIADTYKWVARYTPFVRKVHILRDGESKTSIPADFYIDDGPHIIEDLRENSDATVIVFDRPWNEDVETGGRVVRAHDWEDVLSVVGALV